jgi:hypothetical protein
MIYNKSRGFSLLEIMMVAGILSGLSIVVMNLTKQSMRSSAKYEFDSDKTQITNEITGILSVTNKCIAASGLLGKNATSDTTITSIGSQFYSLVSSTPAPPANGYGNAGIQIANYALNSAPPGIALTTGTTYLLINFKGKNILGFQGQKTSIIKLNVSVDGSGNIVNCNAVASGIGSQWLNSGLNIYYPSGGNVGIGTSTPRGQLDVNGAIVGNAAIANSTSTVDFSTGNVQNTASSCGTYTLNNLKDGSNYTFVVKGAASATCAFTAWSGVGTGALSIHYPSDHAATTASTHTLYGFLVSGTDVYVAWGVGY